MASPSVPSSLRGAKSLSPENIRAPIPAHKVANIKVNIRSHATSTSETNKAVKPSLASKRPPTSSANTVSKLDKTSSTTKTVSDSKLASPKLSYNTIIKKEQEIKINSNQNESRANKVPVINKFPTPGLTSPKLKGTAESITSRTKEKHMVITLETSNSGSKTQRKPEGIAKSGIVSPLNIPKQLLSPSAGLSTIQDKKRVSSPVPLSTNRTAGGNTKRKESMNNPGLAIEDLSEQKIVTAHKKAASSANHDNVKPALQSPSAHIETNKKPTRQSVLSNHADTYKSVQIDLGLDDIVPKSAGQINKYSRKSQGNIRAEDLAIATSEPKMSAFAGRSQTRNKSHSTIKNMNLVIPTICIDNLDSPIEKHSSQKGYNTARAVAANFTPSNDKSLHLDSSLLQADKPSRGNDGQGGIAKRRISLQPSQNSNFSFPIQYFKPIEDSTLDKFIQSINDSQRSKLDIDIDEHESKNSNSPAQSKNSGGASQKSYVVPSSYMNMDTSATSTSNKGKVCQITGFGMTPRDLKQKEFNTDRTPQPNSNRKASSSLIAAEVKPHSKSPVQNRFDQDGSRSYRGKERESSFTIQPKTWKDMRETTASLKSINISSSSRRESAFAGSLTSRQTQKRNGWESDDKFSNLDKLLAQLRDEAQNKTGNTLETDLSLEKGLFKDENELTNPDMDILINKSFAKAFMKIGH